MYNYNPKDKPFIYSLSYFPPLYRRWREWIDFISPPELFLLSDKEILERFSYSSLIQEFIIFKRKISWEDLWEKLVKKDYKLTTLWDEEYPPLLKEIKNPPLFLTYRGNIIGKRYIAIVGTRRPTQYGIKISEYFSRELVKYGFIIVSGLAYGIDTYAHKGALEGGGRTYGILGSSLDFIYPSGNRILAERIVENGALISEYPLGTRPTRYTFPQRNRIISGISEGVFVIEAGEKSGALITASFALNEGREVFAVPGRIIDERSKGTNKLIQEGAKMVLDIIDILEEFHIPFIYKPKRDVILTEDEKKVLQFLNFNPIFIEDLMIKLNMDISRLMFIIVSLQAKGLVEEFPGNRYGRRSDNL